MVMLYMTQTKYDTDKLRPSRRPVIPSEARDRGRPEAVIPSRAQHDLDRRRAAGLAAARYSRSAMIGSTSVARRAGMSAASTPATPTTVAITAYVARSPRETP